MAKTNTFKDSDKVVLVVTGTGMKNMKVLDSTKMNFYHSSLSTLENTLLSTLV
jgi:threonine synthase